jgi:hypothetical protein
MWKAFQGKMETLRLKSTNVQEVSTWIYVPVAAVALKTAQLSTNPFLRIKPKQLDKDVANE